MLVSSDAIILKITPYSETSLIVRMLTREMGKITVIAKGARRPKSTFTALLDPMNMVNCHFYYKESRDIQTLKEMNLASGTMNIRRSLLKMGLALSVIEIIDRVSLGGNPSPILFRLVWRILEKYETSSGIEHLLYAFFLLQLSIRSGFRPNLENCSRCGAPLTAGTLDVNSGDICCSNCLPHGDIKISSDVMGSLRTLAGIHIDRLEELKPAEDRMGEVNRFLLAFLQYHIEELTMLKSTAVLKQLGI